MKFKISKHQNTAMLCTMSSPPQLRQYSLQAAGQLKLAPTYASLSFHVLDLHCWAQRFVRNFAWSTPLALNLAISQSYQGKPCRTLELPTKVNILNKVEKGDVLLIKGNAFFAFCSIRSSITSKFLRSLWTSSERELTVSPPQLCFLEPGVARALSLGVALAHRAET